MMRCIGAWFAGRIAEMRCFAVPMLLLVLGATLAACNARPVYGPSGGYGIDHVTQELAAIDIQSAGDRVGQELRNRLIFNFNRGHSVSEKRYFLTFNVAQSDDAVAIEERSGSPASYRLNLTVQFRLINSETNEPVTAGTVRTSASYDRSSQSFANLRARRDAENRAANTAADDITARLSTIFAQL